MTLRCSRLYCNANGTDKQLPLMLDLVMSVETLFFLVSVSRARERKVYKMVVVKSVDGGTQASGTNGMIWEAKGVHEKTQRVSHITNKTFRYVG